MSDYFETEEIVKEYDRAIALRILSYLKPYRLLALLTAVALGGSTLGELAIPVIQQRVIDDAILARFLLVQTDVLEREQAGLAPDVLDSLKTLRDNPKALRIGTYLFIPQNQDTKMAGRIEAELRLKGILGDPHWYADSEV